MYVAIGAERYRSANLNWPERLEQLVPDYLEYFPVDPFDDKPLRYKRTAKGVIVDSVNDDLSDDDGDLTPARKHSPTHPTSAFACWNRIGGSSGPAKVG